MGGHCLPVAFGQRSVAVQIDEHGCPWFRADDVCRALEFTNPRKAVADHVDEEDVTKRDTLTAGGNQKINFVNESGVYALIFGSTKPVAKKFKKWVTSEVLPAIRQNGFYRLPMQAQVLPDPRAHELEESRQLAPSERQAAERDRRIEALLLREEEIARGRGVTEANRMAAEFAGCSESTVWNWCCLVRMVPEADRAVALTPKYRGGGRMAECHPEALAYMLRQLARKGAKFTGAYRSARKIADKHGWSPIPCERTLRRWVNSGRELAIISVEGRA